LKRAIYPGTFDPITNGHLDIIIRATTIFDEVIIAVADSKSKNPLFDIDKRVEMITIATNHFSNIKTDTFDSLIVDYAQKIGVNVFIRGLRAVSDFEFELQMTYANESLDKTIDTIFFMPKLENAFISSSVVREIINFGGDISHLVPKNVHSYIKKQICT
jgi:pantetheine-phosphate adenylyltransferase